MNDHTSPTQPPRPGRFPHDVQPFAAVALFHFLVGALYKEVGGVTITPGASFNWDQSWHLMPLDLLRDRFLETLWNLHGQPPVYNLWCGVFIKLFHPGYIEAMHYPQIALGALVCGMVYVLLRQFVRSRVVAFAVAVLLALNPSLFLFEASLGHDLMTAFWAVLTVFCLALYCSRRHLGYMAGFLLSLNLLILTRSMFHPVLLLVAIPFACAVTGPVWRRTLVIALLISLLSVGWCAKNFVKFGFFGTSSWAGQNLWTIASANYDRQDLEGFIDAGVIDDTVLNVLVWNRPAAYRAYGFDEESDIEALGRNNYNNVNTVAISRMYGRNALRLLAHRPVHYAVNVAKAYRIFCLPTSRTKYIRDNAARMGLHEAFVSQIVQGQYFTGALGRWIGKDPFFSFWFFVMPATFVAYAIHVARRCGRSRTAWRDYAETQGVLFFTAALIAYLTVVACTCDYGENGRFTFAIEPLLWPFTIGVWHQALRRVS